jgi:hypothetical protein
MQKLDEEVVLRVIREEWATRKATLKEELDAVYKPGEKAPAKLALSPGLKVKHKKSGVLFTIHAIGAQSTILRKPEGGNVAVANKDLESQFDLD